MFKTILHHRASSGGDCAKLCCTKIEDFSVRIGRTDIFSHVNIHIHCGQLTALIGPNGAGKSTLLRAILGEVPHTGLLHYVDAKGKHTGHPVIGYVPQYLRFDVSSPTSVMDLFMVRKSDSSLLYAVDRSIELLDIYSPEWRSELHTKYYSMDDGSNVSFSAEERGYLQELQDRQEVLKVAMVRSAGVEPTPSAPEANVLSTGLRALFTSK